MRLPLRNNAALPFPVLRHEASAHIRNHQVQRNLSALGNQQSLPTSECAEGLDVLQKLFHKGQKPPALEIPPHAIPGSKKLLAHSRFGPLSVVAGLPVRVLASWKKGDTRLPDNRAFFFRSFGRFLSPRLQLIASP